MEFKEIKEEVFREFLDQYPLRTFLQTPEIGRVRGRSGWTIDYVGVYREETLVAATMLLSLPRHLGRLEFYAPRGLLIDYDDHSLLSFFVSELKSYIKKRKGFVLRIDPYVVLQERDINGDVVEGGEDHRDVVLYLEQLGFRKKTKTEQAGLTFVLDLEGKSEEDIQKGMRSNTRNIIRRTMKTGIHLRELTKDQLPEFKQIMVATCERKQFQGRKLSYYQAMYEEFAPRDEIKYIIAELHLKDALHNVEQELRKEEEKLKNLKDTKHTKKERPELELNCQNLKKRLEELKNLQAEKGDIIPLSGSMFVLYQPEIVYLSSGNYAEYMKYYAQYLIQWEMIRYGIEHHYRRYNFYGIIEYRDKKHKDYGIYDFKKGFNGCVEELIGEFELPIDGFYSFFQLLHKIKK